MGKNTEPKNQDEVANIPLSDCAERPFIDFVNKTRLDIAVPVIFVAVFVLFAIGRVTHLLSAKSSFEVAYELVFVVGLSLVIFRHRSLFVGLLYGDLNPRGIWQYGLAPLAVVVPILLLSVLIAFVTHTPIHSFESLSIYRRREIVAGFLAPLGEEIVFRVWLQTRFQQGFGKMGEIFGGARLRPWFSAVGAFLCAALFLANHANGFSQWGIYALAAWLTWLRFRHHSLGAALISHFAWNGTLGLFGILVLTHVLK